MTRCLSVPVRADAARAVYSNSGIGSRMGMGERPAVLVVDLQYGFTDPSCRVGSNLDEVVAATARLLDAARATSLPVAFTVIGFHPTGRDGAVWLRKMPGLADLVEGTRWCEVDERIRPADDEPVFTKRAASAFFGTPLLSFLLGAQADTVIVTGCVTSGCVRASVVDAVSYGLRPIVPVECIGDRAEEPHRWSIFDMDSKYADIERLDDVLAALARRGHAGGAPPAGTAGGSSGLDGATEAQSATARAAV